MRDNKKKADVKMSREEYLYHNTEMLLKKYRDVVSNLKMMFLPVKIFVQQPRRLKQKRLIIPKIPLYFVLSATVQRWMNLFRLCVILQF